MSELLMRMQADATSIRTAIIKAEDTLKVYDFIIHHAEGSTRAAEFLRERTKLMKQLRRLPSPRTVADALGWKI